MKAYKATNKDMICRDFQYEMNTLHVHGGPLEICGSGFHFCKELEEIRYYYSFYGNNRFFEVEIPDDAEIIDDENKSVTDKIKFIKELTNEEIYELIGILREYDDQDNLTYFRNSEGFECWFEYDTQGHMVYYEESNGFESWHEYDANGNMIHYEDSNGLEKWWEHDENGNIIHYKDSDGVERWFEYDANGKCVHYKNFDGFESWSEYDENGNELHYKNSYGIERWHKK